MAAALALSACTLGPPAPLDDAVRSGAVKTDGQKGAKPAPVQEAALPAPETPIDSDPKRLIGLERSELIALLGDPAFRRSDAPAEFWRYRADGCSLNIYLYGPEKTAITDKRVLVRHVEARPSGDGAVTTGECLRALLRARMDRKTS